MNLHADSASPTQVSRVVAFVMLAASAAVAGFAISNQSFWIDEGASLIAAMAPDPAQAWHYAQAVGGSALQAPLYHIYLYTWHKFVGHGGEWALRASNIPILLFGQLAFLVILRHRPRLALTASALALVSPPLWLYLDEARPYLLQYASACWPTAAILRAATPLTPTERWTNSEIALLALAAVLLVGSGWWSALWSAGFVLTLLWLWKKQTPPTEEKSPANLYLALLTVPVLILAVFFALTFTGARGGYFRPGTALLSLPYLAYEFLGFPGFGPGRLELRAAPGAALRAHFAALLPLAAVLGTLAVFAAQHLRRLKPDRRIVLAFAGAVVLPAVLAFALMFLSDHRPLPRYFLPALPALLLGLAILLPAAMTQPHVVFRAAAVMLPLLWLGSSLNLRWHPAHTKDDYRQAAAIAAAALRQNKEVWWAADAATAFIYLTPVALEDVPGRAWAMQGPQWDDIRFKFPPRVIVMSKPDLFDPHGAIARYAAENHFVPALKLHAFTILARENDPLPAVAP